MRSTNRLVVLVAMSGMLLPAAYAQSGPPSNNAMLRDECAAILPGVPLTADIIRYECASVINGLGGKQPVPPGYAADKVGPEIFILRRDFMNFPVNMLIFRNMQEVFDTLPVANGGSVWPLQKNPRDLSVSYRFEGKTYTTTEFLNRTYTNALLVLRNDKIVYENYRNFSNESTHFLSMSVAKSIVSILIGAAIEDGHIKSVNQEVTDYIPRLKGTAWDGVTIRDLLRMRSGTDDDDNTLSTLTGERLRERDAYMIYGTARWTDQAFHSRRVDKPGTVFRYTTLDTIILGELLEKATGESVAQYASERLWKPLGAQAPAYWLSDGPPGKGHAMAGMGFNATARDYARIGLMMLHEGKAGGRQIIPQSWVKESTEAAGPAPKDAENFLGYAYQWWTVPHSDAYTALGMQGQFIYVDPDTKTVIVKLSYFPMNDVDGYAESVDFFRAVSAWKP